MRATPALLLSGFGVSVADRPPPFQYALPNALQVVRCFVPAIEQGLGDRVAWESLFTDEQRLATFRIVYGNRKGPIRRRARASVTSADAATPQVGREERAHACPHRADPATCPTYECRERRADGHL